MSLNLYWQRPPVEVDRRGGVGHPTKGIVARALFDHDGSLRGDAVLARGDEVYHYLRGVKDTTQDDDVRTDLADLLSLVDEYSSVEVFTDE